MSFSSAFTAGQSSANGSGLVRQSRGVFSSDGSFPSSRYLLAVLRSIPAFIAAMPTWPDFVFSSISRLTCASLTVTGISSRKKPGAGTPPGPCLSRFSSTNRFLALGIRPRSAYAPMTDALLWNGEK
ncbi:MAG: hypothetical protein QM765_49220 [Myxococcales bacterium]